MRIRFRQSGGFAGLVRSLEMDSQQLPEQQQKQLANLVEQGGSQKAAQKNSNLRDGFHYELQLEAPGADQQHSFDETTLPQSLRPLVEFLASKATPAKLRK